MSRKKYEYTSIETVNTLRLPVNFDKLKLIDVVDEAFYILSTKKKKKAAYIVKAIEHYDDNQMESNEIKKSIQRFRISRRAKELFNIQNEEDAKRILSLSKDSAEYISLRNRIPEKTDPAKMLLGFKIEDEKFEATHKRLFDLSANERILLISNAVVEYVLDGCDPEMEDVFATKFILSVIDEYQRSEEKKSVIDNFMLAINF